MGIYDSEKDKPKMSQKERDDMMKKFLDKGGKVQKLKPGSAAVLGSMDKSGKPAYTKEDIEKGIKGKTPRPDYKSYKPNTYHDLDLGPDRIPVYVPTKERKD